MSTDKWYNQPNIVRQPEPEPQQPLVINGVLLDCKTLPFTPEKDEVIYVNGTDDPTIDRFVSENLDAIVAAFKAHNFRFIYLPEQGNRLASDEAMWHYLRPDGTPHLSCQPQSLPNDYMLRFMAHPENRDKVCRPALLRLICRHDNTWMYSRYELRADTLRDISIDQLAHIVATKSARVAIFYSPRNFRDADEDFDEEIEWLMRDVRHRINKLRQAGVSDVILASLLEPQPEVKLSQLRITADHRIFLTDYDNTEIEMTPLVKAVFFLFLRHPEGIRIKNLIDCQDELWIIYGILKGRYDYPINDIPETVSFEVEEFLAGPPKNITDLCDPTCNSINEKCARIKEAFLLRFHESIANRYFITGERGELKRITLPRDLVVWETK